MNIAEKITLWSQFKFQLPMIICAIWVINKQKKIIWNTLKTWWSPPQRKIFLKICGVGILALFASSLVGKKRIELEEKCQQEVRTKMLEEKIITQEELNNEKDKEEKKQIIPFYNISPFLAFIAVVIIGPIAEESITRYLIFEIFSKNNPLAYILSGGIFIFLHWKGGNLSFNAISFLLLGYLPMTVLFIYAYRKSKWNITYPMFFHMLWNFLVFCAAMAVVK